MPTTRPDSAIHVSDHQTLKERGVIVVRGGRRRIAVFADGDAVYAVENNCPHMGFPLDKGSVKDGMLTCHWHQARFDLRSGCTFDLWADDVPSHATWLDAGEVYVAPDPVAIPDAALHRTRLIRGLEHNVGLVQAKSILALLEGGASLKSIVGEITRYATQNLNRFSEGLTRLGCVARIFDFLSPLTAYKALYYATRQIGEETSRATPRRARQPLGEVEHELEILKPWMLQWVRTRHRDGAERTVLTGLQTLPDAAVAELVFSAATERLYSNGGHQLEDCNKAFEFTELLGRAEGKNILPLVIPGMTEGRGREESTNWHHPVEIVEPLRQVEERLPAALAPPRNPDWRATADFNNVLLGDDPLAILDTLENATTAGAPPVSLARQVAYAAALRLARFATSNEVSDWFNPQHTFIYSNGVYQAVKRSAAPDVVRGIFHGAISVYMDRYLNVPAAKLPGERNSAVQLPEDPAALLEQLLEELDQRSNIERAADLVSRYLTLEHAYPQLIDTLTLATVREDLDFHCLQVLEAGVNQSAAWGPGVEREHILVGVVRNLAAHCPTRRAGEQTADIARRLHAGEKIFEGEI
jgi:nitrite reductase/ring-hydroxylating ferredoxin subunit